MQRYLVYTREGKYIDSIEYEGNVSIGRRISLSTNKLSGTYLVERLEDIIEGKTSAIWVSKLEDEVDRSD